MHPLAAAVREPPALGASGAWLGTSVCVRAGSTSQKRVLTGEYFFSSFGFLFFYQILLLANWILMILQMA